MKAKLIQLVSWLRAFVPVILRYIPGLAAWSAVKFKKSGKWVNVASGALRVVGGVVIKFIPWVGWILLGAAEIIKLFAK